jgi:UDP-glucose 4-epimerase
VGAGAPFSLLELLAILGRLTGVEPDPVHEGARAGDVARTHADASGARRDLGFEPSVRLEEGLARTVQWFRARRADAPAGSDRVEI